MSLPEKITLVSQDGRCGVRLGHGEAPRLLGVGAVEAQGNNRFYRSAVGGPAISCGNAGGGPVGIVVEEDVDVLGVPAFDDDGEGVGAEKLLGGLGAGNGGWGRFEELLESGVVVGGQSEEDVIGKGGDDLSLGVEGIGGGRAGGGAVFSGGA